MRRVERLINLIIALVETSRPYTAEEIRTTVAGYEGRSDDAFRRTFERDKQDLRAMGIEIDTVATDPFSTVADGYLIRKERFYLPPIDLEPDELAALRLAADAVLGAGEQAGSGLLKLSVASSPGTWSSPGVVWGADLAAEQPHLATLYAALGDRIPVAFDYVDAAGVRSQRSVEPYALVNRRGHWYLAARDRDRDDVRSFKVARIASEIRRLDGSYEIPDDFDADRKVPSEAWDFGVGEPATATVRFDAEARWWAENNMSDLRSTEAENGGLDVQVPVANLDALISWVLGFAGAVEILHPPEARARLRAHLAPFLEDVRGHG